MNVDHSINAEQQAVALASALREVCHPGECGRIHESMRLGYTASIDIAMKLMKNGQQQSRCQLCSKWRWPYEQCAEFMP